jgi:hypothetical protein
MSSSIPRDFFDGGPPLRFERRLGLVTPGNLRIRRRILLEVLVAWAPLAILTAIQQALSHDRSFWNFLLDFGVGARLLVAAPLFIFAESMCLPPPFTNCIAFSGFRNRPG